MESTYQYSQTIDCMLYNNSHDHNFIHNVVCQLSYHKWFELYLENLFLALQELIHVITQYNIYILVR